MKNPTFGTRLRDLRQALKLSQEQFGKDLGMRPNHISRLESGDRGPSQETLRKISTAYSANLNWLLTGQSQMFIPPSGSSPQVVKEQAGFGRKDPRFLKYTENWRKLSTRGKIAVEEFIEFSIAKDKKDRS